MKKVHPYTYVRIEKYFFVFKTISVYNSSKTSLYTCSKAILDDYDRIHIFKKVIIKFEVFFDVIYFLIKIRVIIFDVIKLFILTDSLTSSSHK